MPASQIWRLRNFDEEAADREWGRKRRYWKMREYRDSLAEYTEENRGIFEQLQQFCDEHGDQRELALKMVYERLVNAIAEEVEAPGRHHGFNGRHCGWILVKW